MDLIVDDQFFDAGISRRARRPCRSEAYLPDRLTDVLINLPADVAAEVSDAERAVAAPIRKNSTADLLLRVVPSVPILTVSIAAHLTGRGFQAADLATAHLTRAGVLRPTTLGRRNRAFEVVGLRDTLTTIERRLASPARDTRFGACAARTDDGSVRAALIVVNLDPDHAGGT